MIGKILLINSVILFMFFPAVTHGNQIDTEPPCEPDTAQEVQDANQQAVWVDTNTPPCTCEQGENEGLQEQEWRCHNPCKVNNVLVNNVRCEHGTVLNTQSLPCTCEEPTAEPQPQPPEETEEPTAEPQPQPPEEINPAATNPQTGTQTPPSSETITFRNPLKVDSLSKLLLALINGVTIILMPFIVLIIAYIGFRMVWAGREKNADYTKWKNAFAISLLGLFLVLGARGILYVIQNTLKDVLGPEATKDYIQDSGI